MSRWSREATFYQLHIVAKGRGKVWDYTQYLGPSIASKLLRSGFGTAFYWMRRGEIIRKAYVHSTYHDATVWELVPKNEGGEWRYDQSFRWERNKLTDQPACSCNKNSFHFSENVLSHDPECWASLYELAWRTDGVLKGREALSAFNYMREVLSFYKEHGALAGFSVAHSNMIAMHAMYALDAAEDNRYSYSLPRSQYENT